MDPVTGRDEEIRQIVDILMRRRQNNPILTGEAGVGKTAVVEGFAQRLARGDVPPQLKEVSLLSLDLGLLQAGASMKGEFEQRLRQVIDEVQASPKPIILFIDEVHTLVGAGGAAGTGDAANLLKPALARGNLRTIGATTWAEYKKYIEKDPALTRRFQVVQVPEPDEHEGRADAARRRDGAREAPPRAAARRGDRGGGQALASLHPGAPAARQGGQPARHRMRARRRQPACDAGRGRGLPAPHRGARDRVRHRRPRGDGRRARSATRGTDVAAKLAGRARPRWSASKRAGRTRRRSSIASSRCGRRCAAATSRSTARPPPARAGPRARCSPSCRSSRTSSPTLQGESPLIMPSVDAQAVASVVSDWTGIPVGRMVKNELESMLRLGEIARPARHRPAARPRHDRQAHPDLARAARQPEQADRRLHAVRHVGRRQDRDRARARRSALRRRAERHHDQHERVPGGPHRLHAEGLAAGLRRLRRRRHPDRGGAASAVQRRAARRGREGPLRRARAVLPGLRQGPHGRRRGPA